MLPFYDCGVNSDRRDTGTQEEVLCPVITSLKVQRHNQQWEKLPLSSRVKWSTSAFPKHWQTVLFFEYFKPIALRWQESCLVPNLIVQSNSNQRWTLRFSLYPFSEPDTLNSKYLSMGCERFLDTSSQKCVHRRQWASCGNTEVKETSLGSFCCS